MAEVSQCPPQSLQASAPEMMVPLLRSAVARAATAACNDEGH
jgi:hypothetical protein